MLLQNGPRRHPIWGALDRTCQRILMKVNSILQGVKTLSGWWCNKHLEKYESQWEGLSHVLWKIKTMFETTNQLCIMAIII
jgi:hypothetical protein